MIITETWLRAEDQVVIAECLPAGYAVVNAPRPTDPHGGIAVIFKSPLQLQLKMDDSLTYSTFELAHVVSNGGQLHFLVVYRPPPSVQNQLRTADFLQEFDDLTAEISRLAGRVLLLGDFNIHVDKPSKSDVAQFLSIIESASLVQHVTGATHNMGHTLDLVMTRDESNHQGQSSADICPTRHGCIIEDIVIHHSLMSDHHCIRFVLRYPRPVVKKVRRTFRNFKEMDIEGFSEALIDKLNDLSSAGDVDSVLTAYNTSVAACVNEFAPQKSGLRSTRVRNPWFNEEILTARRERRRIERKWIKSSSDTDHTSFKLANKHVNDLIDKAKQKYYTELLCKANVKTVFNVVNNLLHKNVKFLPVYDNPLDLANRFSLYFVKKISDIRNNVTNTPEPRSVDSQEVSSVHEKTANATDLSLEQNITIESQGYPQANHDTKTVLPDMGFPY
ncbi:uncharacterized protein LOC129274037 [Lytechinus pictus]|uniref:uncharacterized protein LOC129274037 n=1 Tax=Lytechinus pictus TaxID=7653 RepID=UPI0030B9EA79